MPSTGATKVPKYCKDPNRVSSRTEPVATNTYQPRIRFSISVPQEVSRSAGYWNRKLRTWNGASNEDRRIALTLERCSTPHHVCSWPLRPLSLVDSLRPMHREFRACIHKSPSFGIVA